MHGRCMEKWRREKEVRVCEERKMGGGAKIEATKRCKYPGDLLRSSLAPF